MRQVIIANNGSVNRTDADKPIYCPLSFAVDRPYYEGCTVHCAWFRTSITTTCTLAYCGEKLIGEVKK